MGVRRLAARLRRGRDGDLIPAAALVVSLASVTIVALLASSIEGTASPPGTGLGGGWSGTSPIRHVIVLYQENHTFDNVLGFWCARTGRCDGVTDGALPDGSTTALARAPDVVPQVTHDTSSQRRAVDGGRMDGFGAVPGCTKQDGYRCYSQFRPARIPNTIALAEAFDVSDHTFQMDLVPSWGAHLELAAPRLSAAAVAGTLPNFGIVAPNGWVSQHNYESMRAGDWWIGRLVSALMRGPEWDSTAIFTTWDDFGGFYDHVPPPAGLGLRVPMLIVSPYAKAGSTDTHVASIASILAFAEHNFR